MLQTTPAPSSDRVPANQRAEQISKSQLWQERIANYERSALSVVEYCRSIECSVASFYQWRRKLRQSTPKSAFLSVQTSTLEVGDQLGTHNLLAAIGTGHLSPRDIVWVFPFPL